MNGSLRALGALGIGAGAMFLLDPDRGRRRRAVLRDRTSRVARKTGEAIGITARDLSNRSRGILHELRSLSGSEQLSDEALALRIRSRLGRVASHPRAIEVDCRDGDVILRGIILERELRALLRSIRSVRGVRSLRSELEVHASADVSALQGGRRRPGNSIDIAQEHWAPATRFLAGAAGSLLAIVGARSGGILGAFCAISGGALLARGTTNVELRRMIGLDDEDEAPRAIMEPMAATSRREALASMN
jgi:hypothetical protein